MNVAVAQRGIGSAWDELILALSGDASTTGLAKAIIAHESEWNPAAVNPADPSVGLMQLLVGPEGPYPGYTAAQLADPGTNLTLGIQFLRQKLARYGPTSDAIAAYNAGTPRKNAANQYINSRGSTSVQAYVDDVQEYWVWYLNHDPLLISTDPGTGALVPADPSVHIDPETGQASPTPSDGVGLSGAAVGLLLLVALLLGAARRLV